MSPLESSTLTPSRLKYSNTAEAQDKDLEIALMNMIEAHTVEMNKSFKEIYENTNNESK